MGQSKCNKGRKICTKKYSQVNLSWSGLPVVYCPCPHKHFNSPTVDRKTLDREQYTNLLATPKGYTWDNPKQQDCKPPTMCKLNCNKKKTSVDCTGDKGPQCKSQQMDDIGKCMTPEMCEKLMGIFVNDFNMPKNEANQFIEEQKVNYKNNKMALCKCPCAKGDADQNTWMKEFSDLIGCKLKDQLASVLCGWRTKRQKVLMELIVNAMNDVLCECINISCPETRMHRVLVYAADRLACWLDKMFEDASKKAVEEEASQPPSDDDDQRRREEEERAKKEAEDRAKREQEEADRAASSEESPTSGPDADELARQQAADELARQQAADELARQQAADELARQQAADELAKQQAADELAKQQAADELAKQQAAAEKEGGAEQEAARRKAEEESEKAKLQAEAAERARAEEERARAEEEERARQQAEGDRARAEEEARARAEKEEADRRAAEAAASVDAAGEELPPLEGPQPVVEEETVQPEEELLVAEEEPIPIEEDISVEVTEEEEVPSEEKKKEFDPMSIIVEWIEETDYAKTDRQKEIGKIVKVRLCEGLAEYKGQEGLGQAIDKLGKKVSTWIDKLAAEAEKEIKPLISLARRFKAPKGILYHVKRSDDNYYNVKQVSCDDLAQHKLKIHRAMTSDDIKDFTKWAEGLINVSDAWTKWVENAFCEAYTLYTRNANQPSELTAKEFQAWREKKRKEAIDWKRAQKSIYNKAQRWEEWARYTKNDIEDNGYFCGDKLDC